MSSYHGDGIVLIESLVDVQEPDCGADEVRESKLAPKLKLLNLISSRFLVPNKKPEKQEQLLFCSWKIRLSPFLHLIGPNRPAE